MTMQAGTTQSAGKGSGRHGWVSVRSPTRTLGLAIRAVVATLLIASATAGCREKSPPKPRPAGVSVRPLVQPPVTSVPQHDPGGWRVLLVHSYHPEYPWVDSVTRGISAVMRGTGIRLEIFHMDTKRHTDEAWKVESGNRARKKVDEYRPDIVLAIDDDAQQYFAKGYVNTPLPIVFCGVDADPSKYGYPAPNVTGIIERPHFRQSLALARRLRPIRRAAVMSCRDSTSIAALGFMRQEHPDVEIAEWLLVDDFDQWKEAVSRFNDTVDALVIRSYQAVKKPGTRENVDPKEVVGWTARNTTIPTIAFHDFEIRDGMLVGVVKSGEEYGGRAMEYALRILRGTPPSALPITRTKLGINMINRDTARRLGISLTGDVTQDVTIVPGN
jgi:ABC-type uncharacterized transport system substrate-binding protein